MSASELRDVLAAEKALLYGGAGARVGALAVLRPDVVATDNLIRYTEAALRRVERAEVAALQRSAAPPLAYFKYVDVAAGDGQTLLERNA